MAGRLDWSLLSRSSRRYCQFSKVGEKPGLMLDLQKDNLIEIKLIHNFKLLKENQLVQVPDRFDELTGNSNSIPGIVQRKHHEVRITRSHI